MTRAEFADMLGLASVRSLALVPNLPDPDAPPVLVDGHWLICWKPATAVAFAAQRGRAGRDWRKGQTKPKPEVIPEP